MPPSRRVVLAARSDGIPQAENFPSSLGAAGAEAGRGLGAQQFLSVEPAMRGWVSTVSNSAQPVGIGEVMRFFGGKLTGGGRPVQR